MKQFFRKFDVFFIIFNCVFASLLVIAGNEDKLPLTFFIRNLTAMAIAVFFNVSFYFFKKILKYIKQLPGHGHRLLTGLKLISALIIFLCFGLGTYTLLLVRFISLWEFPSSFAFSVYGYPFIADIIIGGFCCLINVVFNFIKRKRVNTNR